MPERAPYPPEFRHQMVELVRVGHALAAGYMRGRDPGGVWPLSGNEVHRRH